MPTRTNPTQVRTLTNNQSTLANTQAGVFDLFGTALVTQNCLTAALSLTNAFVEVLIIANLS